MPVTINGNGAISGLVIATGDIADGAVTTPKIADGAVATVDIADAAVTLAKMANVATGTVLGRSTAGTGVPEALTTLPAVSGANLTNLNATNLASGTVPDARFPATLPAASGANLTNLNASNLSTGTVGTARLGTGTANSTTFLRGDGTWATAGGAPANLTDVGAILIVANGTTSSYAPGNTVAGSSLWVPTSVSSWSTSFGTNSYPQLISGSTNLQFSPGGTSGGPPYGRLIRTGGGNPGWVAPEGSTQLSGTWRILWYVGQRTYAYQGTYNEFTAGSNLTLAQRIS